MYYIYTYKYLQSSLFIIPNPPQEPLHKYHVPVFVRSGHCLVQRWRARRSTGAMATDPYTIVCYGQPAKGHLDQPRILSKTNQSLEHVFFSIGKLWKIQNHSRKFLFLRSEIPCMLGKLPRFLFRSLYNRRVMGTNLL